jgi:hypothetical protein
VICPYQNQLLLLLLVVEDGCSRVRGLHRVFAEYCLRLLRCGTILVLLLRLTGILC